MARRHNRGAGESEAVPARGVPSGEVARSDRWRRGRRRLFLLLGLLLGLSTIAWTSGALGAIPRWQAAAGLAERDYGKATYWLGVAQWLGPSDPENALLAARVARHQGKGSELQKQLARAGALGADRERIEREEMLAIVAMGDLVDYESKLIDWMATAGPELPEICDAYVNGLAANGRFAEAGQVLSAWQKDFPNDARCDYRIGRIREHQEAYDKAEQHYRDAISKSERFYAAIFSLARVMQHQRRAEEALQQFTLCFAMPAPEAAKIEAAVALKALGRTDEARNMLLEVLKSGFERQQESYRAVEEQPEGFRAAAEYGRLESDAGNFKAAKPWLVAALDANPLDLTVRYALAVTQRGLGELDAAEANFEHVSKAREAMGAATALNERAQANRNDLEARFLLGKLILEHESERMGLYWIRSILPINPLYRPAHELLAEHYAQKASSEPHYQRLADYHRQQAALSPPTTTADTTPAEPSQP